MLWGSENEITEPIVKRVGGVGRVGCFADLRDVVAGGARYGAQREAIVKRKIDQDNSVGLRRIRSAISTNHNDLADGKAPRNPQGGLLVSQNGGRTESRAFEFYGAAAYIANVTITIKLPRFAISGFDLSLPWQSYVWWLADPRDRAARPPVYRFDRDYILEYNRDQVLNQVADVRRLRSQGESLQGYLLGIGNDPIPEQFNQGAIIPAFLIVYDQYGDGHRSPLSLWTDRTGRYFRRARSGQARKGRLLDKLDPTRTVRASE